MEYLIITSQTAEKHVLLNANRWNSSWVVDTNVIEEIEQIIEAIIKMLDWTTHRLDVFLTFKDNCSIDKKN